MRFLKYLQEEWIATRKRGKSSYPIFVNPDKSELTEIIKTSKWGHGGVRFIADFKGKKVYVWDAGEEIHDSVYRFLKLTTPSNLRGSCVYHPGQKMKCGDPGLYGEATLKTVKEAKWLEKWFDLQYLIDKLIQLGVKE